MRSSLFPRLLAALAVTLALLAPRLSAQATVAVKIYAQASVSFQGSDYGELMVSAPLGSADVSTDTSGTILLATVSNVLNCPGTVQLQPDASNTVYVTGYNLDQGELDVVAPPGYRVIMDHMVRTRETFTGNSASFVIQLQSLGANHPQLAGIAYKVSNTAIDWRLSLGSLLNGTSAGELALVDPGTESDWSPVFTPSALTYESTADEVTVLRPNNILRQIMADQMAVDIVTLTSTSYEIRCYHPAQADAYAAGSTYLSFSGQPFVTYRIAQGATATTLTITKETRNVTDLNATNLPIARTEVMTMTRTGSWPTQAWTNSDWTLAGQTPLSETFIQSSGDQGNRSESIAIRVPGSSTPAISISRTYTVPTTGAWVGVHYTTLAPIGEVLAGETVGSTNGMTAGVSYNTDVTQFGSLGTVSSATLPGGNWVAYDYYDADPNTGVGGGRVKYCYKPFGNNQTSVSHSYSGAGDVTYYEYSNDPFGVPTRPSLVQTNIGGGLASMRTIVYDDNYATVNGSPVTQATQKDYSSYSNPQTNACQQTVTTYYREDSPNTFLRGEPNTITAPNTATATYTYERGTWDGTTFTSYGAGDLSPSYVAWAHGQIYSRITVNTPGAVCATAVTIRDRRALVVRTEKWGYANSIGSVLVSFTNFTYDFAGHLTNRVSNNGATYSAVYDGGLKTSETDESGVVTTYLYDAADRVQVATRTGSGAIAAVATHYAYDAAGHVIEERVGWTQSGSTEQIVTTRQYDDAGRLKSETPAGLGTTNHSYDVANRIHTTTNPDGSTLIETSYLDGRPYSKKGTATVAEYYSYGWDGQQYRQVNSGTANSSRVTKSWTDLRGRVIRADDNTGGETQNFYDEPGGPSSHADLYRSTQTGSAAKLYEHDLDGTLIASALDTNNDGSSQIDSLNDRGSRTTRWILQDSNNGFYFSAKTYTYTKSGSYSAAITLSNTWLTGLPANRVSEVQSVDEEGNTTTTTVDVNRAARTSTKTTTHTGIANAQYEYSIDGLPTSTLGSDGLTTSTTYDALLRVQAVTDSRGNQTKTTYYAGTKLVYQTIEKANTSSPVVVATYHYDSMGRKDWQDDAAGASHRTYSAYNRRGQLLRQWGPGTYPVAYAYSVYGEQIAMRTFRNPTQDFTTATWPLSDDGADPTNPDPTSWTTGDITKWVYSDTSGLLMEKQFPALPGQTAKRISYTYVYGTRQIKTRQWERTIPSGQNAGQRVTATYTYDPVTGEQTGISYNDGTPPVSYTFTRLGKIDSVSDATGACDWVYDPSYTWRLASQAYDTFYGQRVFTPLYESSGVVGRGHGFRLGAAVGSNSELEQTYGYDGGTGRFNTLTSGRNANASTRNFHYGYEPNSPLVKTLWTDDNSFFITRSFEPNRDVLTSLETKWGASAPSDFTNFTYQTNDLHQRSSVVQSGDAFAGDGYSGATNALNENFTYDARGELATAPTALGSDPANPGTALANRQFEFNFDAIGNRQWAGVTGNAADRKNYAANALNQYTARDNALAPFSSTQAFTYDLDGNLTNDGLWQYTWDAENRLVTMVATAAAVTAGNPNLWIDFKYDYLGRRVEKRVTNLATNGGVILQRRYLYDGWSLIAEYSVSGSALTLVRSYTWGLDIARSLTDAGGVGALLQIADHASGKSYQPAYDGNGNIAALINGSTGAVAAVYEYSPFGELLRADTPDSTVAGQPFRFSTKFTDDETGLVYYGKRFYSPSQGRFLGRDPKEEAGGLNLYGFCGNNGVDRWDYLGMDDPVQLAAFTVAGKKWTQADEDAYQQWLEYNTQGGGIDPDYEDYICRKNAEDYQAYLDSQAAKTAPNSGTISLTYNTFIPSATVTDPLGRIFAGDGRNPGDPGTYRTTQTLTINPALGGSVTSTSNTGISIRYDSNGNVVASAQASPTAGFSATRTGVARDGTEVFTFSGSSSNPLGNVGPIPVPAIDYGGTVIVSPNGSVTVNLSHDGFPGHELYVNGQLVYTYNPQQAGSGPLRLLPVTPSVNTQITLPAPGTPPHP